MQAAWSRDKRDKAGLRRSLAHPPRGQPAAKRHTRSGAAQGDTGGATQGDTPTPRDQPAQICPVEQKLLQLHDQLTAKSAEKNRLHSEVVRLGQDIDQLREQLHDIYDTKVTECNHDWTPSPRTSNRVCTRCLVINDGTRHIGSSHWSRA